MKTISLRWVNQCLVLVALSLTACGVPSAPITVSATAPGTAVTLATLAPTLMPSVTPQPPTATPTRTATNIPPSATATRTTTSTPTKLPPTVTPSRTATATATTVPPTATQPATAAPVSAAAGIQAALGKNRALTSYRGSISFHIGQAQFLDWLGDVSGPNAHFSFISDWYSTDREMIVVGEKTYRRNYNYGTKSYDGDWAQEPQEESLYYVQSPRDTIADAVGNPSVYHKASTMNLDDMDCQTYESDDKAAIALRFLTATNNMGKSFTLADPSSAEQLAGGRGAEKATLVICPDGYVHGVMLELDIPTNPTSDVGATLDKITFIARLADPNAAIKIEAP